MLNVDQYEYIRTAQRVYGKNVSEIARETGHSRNTVKKVLRGEFTGYSARKTQPYPVLGPYHEIIYKWLEGTLKVRRSSAIRRSGYTPVWRTNAGLQEAKRRCGVTLRRSRERSA